MWEGKKVWFNGSVQKVLQVIGKYLGPWVGFVWNWSGL